MTLEEKVRSIVGKKIAIWCETKEEAILLTDCMYKITEEEVVDIRDKELWSYDDKTCYCLDNADYWEYGSKDFFEENNYTIINYKDFVNDNYLNNNNIITTLSFNDITELLNTTYGKGKWVIK